MGVRDGKGRVFWGGRILFAVLVVGIAVSCSKVTKLEKIEDGKADKALGPDKRTYLVSKLLLIPTLAAIGLKFLLLLPIFLSKIALLSVLNFVASKLNLLLSAIIGVKNFLTTSKPTPAPYESTGTKDYMTEYKLVYNQPQHLQTYELLHDKVIRQPGLLISNHDDAKFKRSSFQNKRYQPPRYEPESRVTDQHLFDRQKTKYKDNGKYACYWLKDDQDIVKRSHVQKKKFKVNRIQPHQPHWIPPNFEHSFVDRYDSIPPDIPIEESNLTRTSKEADLKL